MQQHFQYTKKVCRKLLIAGIFRGKIRKQGRQSFFRRRAKPNLLRFVMKCAHAWKHGLREWATEGWAEVTAGIPIIDMSDQPMKDTAIAERTSLGHFVEQPESMSNVVVCFPRGFLLH